MDEEAVEEAGSDPVLPLLTSIDSVGTLSDLTRMLGEPVPMAQADVDSLYARYQNVYGQVAPPPAP